MAHTILILGASYAGVVIAHKLLKTAGSGTAGFKVILVNPSTHFYWNLASVRAIIPGQIKDQEIFQDLSLGFNYPTETFEFVTGIAENVDVEKKIVVIHTATGEQEQAYDLLIVATGARALDKEVPWKASGTYDEMLERLHEMQRKVEKANSIVVAGGGATGVELAGELGFEYGDNKNIKLLITDNMVMDQSFPPYMSNIVEKELQKLKVNIVRKARVIETVTASNGLIEALLESGQKVTADLFLPTFGLAPNSGFLSRKFLNGRSEVVVDEYFRVKGATAIYAVGDVADIQRNAWVYTIPQAEYLAKSIGLILKGKEPLPYKSPKDVLVVAIGRSRGAGLMGGWRIPSLFAWMGKGRTLAKERMNGFVTGSRL